MEKSLVQSAITLEAYERLQHAFVDAHIALKVLLQTLMSAEEAEEYLKKAKVVLRKILHVLKENEVSPLLALCVVVALGDGVLCAAERETGVGTNMAARLGLE